MVSNKLIKVQKYDRTEFEGYVAEKHFMMAYKLFSLNSENIGMKGCKKQQLFFSCCFLKRFLSNLNLRNTIYS